MRPPSSGVKSVAWVVGGLVVIAIIGSALAASFLPGAAPSPQPLAASLPEVVEVSRGQIRSIVTFDGVIAAAAPVEIRAKSSGEITAVEATIGEKVDRGDSLLVVSDGVAEQRVLAPENGILLTRAEVGLDVGRGDLVATVAPDRYQALAVIDPSLLYRLYEPPVSLMVAIEKGPAPFACAFASLGAEGEPGANPFDAPVVFRCDIPADIRVFAGIRLRIAAITAEVTNVLTLPVEAVIGAADRGIVTFVGRDGAYSQRTVQLGITDGIRIEIVAGLDDGDKVLDPPHAENSAPSSPAP